jgi:hypothetical protein
MACLRDAGLALAAERVITQARHFERLFETYGNLAREAASPNA